MSNLKQKSGAVKGRDGKIVRIDEGEIRSHLSEVVRGTVEETLNAMLDAEADRLCYSVFSFAQHMFLGGIMGRPTPSYLSGDEWNLLVHFKRDDPDRENAWFDEIRVIKASYEDEQAWNDQFWRLFPEKELALMDCVQMGEGICISTDFLFKPTVSLKETYGKYPRAKMSRVAAHWRDAAKRPPPELQKAIDDFEHDEILYDEQYESAWKEFYELRLPRTPYQFYWRVQRGGLIMSLKETYFRLWDNRLGYMPLVE